MDKGETAPPPPIMYGYIFLFDCFIVVHGSLYPHMQLLFTRLLDEYESGRCQLTLGIDKGSESGGLRSG